MLTLYKSMYKICAFRTKKDYVFLFIYIFYLNGILPWLTLNKLLQFAKTRTLDSSIKNDKKNIALVNRFHVMKAGTIVALKL